MTTTHEPDNDDGVDTTYVEIDDSTVEPLEPDSADEQLEPLDPERLRHRPLMSRLSWTLVAIALIGIGFVAGAKVKEQNSSTSSGPSLPGGLSLPAGFDPSSFGAGGLPGGNATATQSPATTSGGISGTIVLINSGKIYVKGADGSTSAVAIASGTTITLGTPGTAAQLQIGDTVVVNGAKDSSGVVAATEIATTGSTETTTPATPTTDSSASTGSSGDSGTTPTTN